MCRSEFEKSWFEKLLQFSQRSNWLGTSYKEYFLSWWGKIVGGTFGFMMGGPLGAVMGAALGNTLTGALKP